MTIITGDNNQTETKIEIEIETGVNEEKKNEDDVPPKKKVETYEERQVRLKTEARAFALSGYSTTKKQQQQQPKTTTKKRTTLPVKRSRAVAVATKAAAAYSSDDESLNSNGSSSSISDFSDDDNNNNNKNNNNNNNGGGRNKKRKVAQQEPSGGGGSIYTPQVVYQMPRMMYPQYHMPSQPQPQLSTQSQYNSTTVVVRVQVPYEELLPGRKMVVDLPNRRLPLEVIIPSYILPGTIIPVQVPPLLNNNPYYYYSQQNNHPPPQQQQQGQQQQQQQPQQQKEQVVGKEKRNTTAFWDQNWYNMFHRLVAYQKEYNTTNVSRRQHRKYGTRLGRWVYQQREEQNKNTNKKMTKEKIQLLNSIDFDWGRTTRRLNTPWNEMYQQLAEYYRKNNSTKLSKKNDGYDTKLFQWMNGQRERYRKNTLTQEQITVLKDIHFDFEYSLKNTWMKNYHLLVTYQEEHGGSTRVPKTTYPELGNGVSNQRRRKMRLKKERIDLLYRIDFECDGGRKVDVDL